MELNKSLLFVCGILSLVVLSGCAVTSSKRDARYNYTKMQSGRFNNTIPVALKDFEVKGVVFAESKIVFDNESGDGNGSEITFTQLMEEAVKLGADDIINVRIDKTEFGTAEDSYKKDPVTGDEKFAKRSYTSKTVIYKATAIAIKYTNAIIGNAPVSQLNNDAPVTAQKQDNNKVYNDIKITSTSGDVNTLSTQSTAEESRKPAKSSPSKKSTSSKSRHSVVSLLTGK